MVVFVYVCMSIYIYILQIFINTYTHTYCTYELLPCDWLVMWVKRIRDVYVTVR